MPEFSVTEVRALLGPLLSELEQLSFRTAVADLDLPRSVAEKLTGLLGPHSPKSVDDEAARVLALGLKEWIEIHNQFLSLPRASEVKLGRAVSSLLEELEHSFTAAIDPDARLKPFESALVTFQKALGQVLRELGAGEIPKEVVAAEYSPELQLSLLGLRPESMLEPVLDLGCGKEQALCKWLRAQGKDVIGFDRHLPAVAAGVAQSIAGDWLDHDFGNEIYGTILSHQAFSLQFWHQHLASEKVAARYAQKYMALLAALKRGGSLVYTPGLPFIERHLPASRWLVQRREFPPELGHGVSQAMKLMLGDDAAYACAVERR